MAKKKVKKISKAKRERNTKLLIQKKGIQMEQIEQLSKIFGVTSTELLEIAGDGKFTMKKYKQLMKKQKDGKLEENQTQELLNIAKGLSKDNEEVVNAVNVAETMLNSEEVPLTDIADIDTLVSGGSVNEDLLSETIGEATPKSDNIDSDTIDNDTNNSVIENVKAIQD